MRARADAEQAHVVALQREGAEAVRRAAEQERARIARELHDVVTHNVSVMVIQAGAARQVLEASPRQAREALLSVEASGRAAMTELRHVMGLLTADGETLDLAPQPGMAELESLVGRVRASGLPVELVVTGSPDTPMPDGVVLAGYRVVQEALTNVVKHAAGSSATVRVERRQHQDPRPVGIGRQDATSRLAPVQHGHADVHQHHVGTGTPDGIDRLGAGGRLGDDVDAVGGEDHPEAGAHQGLVVGHHDPDGVAHGVTHEVTHGVSTASGLAAGARGMTASSLYPPRMRGPASSVPP